MTETDRELLEFAAKAAGVEFGWQHIFDDYEGSTSEKWDWNPLTDMFEAVQLACILKISVMQYPEAVQAKYPMSQLPVALIGEDCPIFASDSRLPFSDRTEKTCRAIVTAAAEIGRALP